MKIKLKIRYSNIIMIVMPVLVILIFILLSNTTRIGRYWSSLNEMFKDDNGVYSAQSLLYAYGDELTEYNWENYNAEKEAREKQEENHSEGEGSEENERSEIINQIERTNAMISLENELSDMGYHFQVYLKDAIVYDNLSEEKSNALKIWPGSSAMQSDSFMITKNNQSVLKYSFTANEKKYSIVAVYINDDTNTGSSYLNRYITSFLLVMIAIFIVVIVISNMIITRYLSKSIMVPLHKLKKGSNEIKNGNLDAVIDYNNEDEFLEVCKNFDEMRMYLKESVYTRLSYENYRKEMISGISHDLRTPLTTIKGYVAGMKEGIANTPEKKERYLNAIEKRAFDMEKLVDNLSNVAKYETTDYKYNLEATNINDFIEEIVNEYNFSKKDLKIELLNNANNCNVNIDKEEMRRVFINIFENAIKYVDMDLKKMGIYMNIYDNNLKIDCIDNGRGINESELEAIFKSFYRCDSSRTQFEKGSGLGLSICKKIVEGNNGKIYAKNKKGFCITIELPIMEVNDAKDTSSRR